MNKLLILSLLVTSSLAAMQHNDQSLATQITTARFKQSALCASEGLSQPELYHDFQGFLVKQDNHTQRINSYDIEQPLQDITADKLEKIAQLGCYIKAHQMDNGDYTLDLTVPGKGGGPIAGWIAYCVTKSLCYGTAVAAAGAAVVATGGAAGAVVGTGATAATLGASTGASLVGGAIAGAGLTAEAATITTAVVTSSGTIAGAVAAVESLSAGMGALFTALPIP